jgi:hypothetical protein
MRERLDVLRAVGRAMLEMSGHVERRNALHARLRRTWLDPDHELAHERPRGSSLHYLLDYDREHTRGAFAKDFPTDDCQVVLVEHDWTVPPVEGEWRLPFSLVCWEFRIDGVRVLAFTDVEGGTGDDALMYLVYGADDAWVIDDAVYDISHECTTLPPARFHNARHNGNGGQSVEFRRVASYVFDRIRAVCIMLDARVAGHETVQASEALGQRRAREGRAPLRDYYVVRLFGTEHRSYAQRPRVAGKMTETRAPQRGHWRRGTWVHYDDPDSGEVQYPNDGGFIVSKTWRRWHFAGDPNNIIHRELRA